MSYDNASTLRSWCERAVTVDSTRKHARYSCNGSADIIDEAQHRVWGHLGDISKGGFYLSTFGPLPVDTEVRFNVEECGEKFSGLGVVKTSHPGVGMAVTYMHLTPEDEAILNSILQRLGADGEQGAGTGLQV